MLSMLYLVRSCIVGCAPRADRDVWISQLYGARRRTREIRSSSELIVRRLIRFTLESGLACALTACLELILFLALPDTNIHICM